MAVNDMTSVIRKFNADALIPPERAAPPRDGKRGSLRFWPVVDEQDDDPELSTASVFPRPPDLDEETRDTVATVGMVCDVLDGAVAITDERVGPLRVKVAGLQTENAQLRGALAELKSKVAELDFVTERLRIENKGPPGLRGERGRDGRDGPRGERGDRGERGEQGKAAPTITGWQIDEATFTATPVLGTGSLGAPLRLQGLFEHYRECDELTDTVEEDEAASAGRVQIEREAARVRAGLPPR
jgi:hypothetical protein